MTSDLIEKYAMAVDMNHRRTRGQFFTPPSVAAFMCRWVLSGVSQSLYDPAFGLGAFFFAGQSLNPSLRFGASEVDRAIIDHFQRHAPSLPFLSLACEDYLAVWGATHDGIVCNPPYMRFQHFINRNDVSSKFQRNLGIRLSGYTNIASAFLLKSLSELSQGARLAYIMPLEFLNTGYGSAVKERLLARGALKALIRLDPEREVFPDAITSAGIILACNDGEQVPVRFYSVRALEHLDRVLAGTPTNCVSPHALNPSDKWLKYFDEAQPTIKSTDLVTLDCYGRFTRGIATGANKFFAISPSRAKQLSIPRSSFLDCITKSAQLKSCVFTREDFEELERTDANVLLLNVSGTPDESTSRYLRYGEENGYHLRYLTKVRTPWYKIERRLPAPLLFGVFSRDKFKVVRNLSTAVNLTCYHGFYPNLFGQQYIDPLALYFQSSAARHILSLSVRRYGDGLDKFEPNDLNRALAPSARWLARLPVPLVARAIEHCRAHQSLPAEVEAIFESLIESA